MEGTKWFGNLERRIADDNRVNGTLAALGLGDGDITEEE